VSATLPRPDLQPETERRWGIRACLRFAAFALVVVALSTNHGDGSPTGGTVTTLVVGGLLLWLVRVRRSRVARGVLVVWSAFGLVVHAVVALSLEADGLLLAAAYLGVLLPMTSPAVRAHVRR
jgi:FtsH-binding integral membrane protein